MRNSLTAIDREEGLKSAVGEDNSNVYDTVYCDSDEQRAFELTTQLLNEHPDITVLAGLDQYSSAGAARAVAQLGLSGRVKVVGFDNSKEQIKYLEEGIYEGLVIQKAFNMGYLGIEAAVELAAGRTCAHEQGFRIGAGDERQYVYRHLSEAAVSVPGRVNGHYITKKVKILQTVRFSPFFVRISIKNTHLIQYNHFIAS